MIRAVLFVLAALFFGGGAAQAADHDLTEPVAGHPGATYFDLVKTIVPDLRLVDQHGVGTTAIAVRYVEDLGDADEEPTPTSNITVYRVQVLPIEAGGRSWWLMLADLGEADGWASHFAVMALFDENLSLSDAINVGLDQTTEMVDDLIAISLTDQAVLTHSEHFNSNQTYGAYAVVLVQDGRFATLDTFYLLSDRWCGHVRTQGLDVSAEDTGAGRWPITVAASDKQEVVAEDLENGGCGEDAGLEQPFETVYTATYSWSASLGTYVSGSDDFARLGEINADRY